jgi:hypothetical protein
VSNDDGFGDDGEFEDFLRDSIQPQDILDKPDINDYLDLGDYDRAEWETTWEIAPVEDFTDGQIDAFIEMVLGSELTWEELWDAMYEDFWEWWAENYGEQ